MYPQYDNNKNIKKKKKKKKHKKKGSREILPALWELSEINCSLLPL
jgi:hypothetical protein